MQTKKKQFIPPSAPTTEDVYLIRPVYGHLACGLFVVFVISIGLLIMYVAKPRQCETLEIDSCFTRCCQISNETCINRIQSDCLTYVEEVVLHETVVGVTLGIILCVIGATWFACTCYASEFVGRASNMFYQHLSTVPNVPQELREMGEVEFGLEGDEEFDKRL